MQLPQPHAYRINSPPPPLAPPTSPPFTPSPEGKMLPNKPKPHRQTLSLTHYITTTRRHLLIKTTYPIPIPHNKPP